MSAPYQYPTDLSDEQWAFLQPYLPSPNGNPGDEDDRHATCEGLSMACCISIRPAASGV